MILSDLSVKRPVFASVISLLLVAFGIVSFTRLPLREYPDIDPPVVSVETDYRGASAAIVESQITQLLEDRIAGVEGIEVIQSSSQDGSSSITIEFDLERDIDAAANDVREAISGVLDNLPEEADPPEIRKADASGDVILWLNLSSSAMNTLELTDYADRYLVDRFSVLDGVARVRVGGGIRYAIRIWLDGEALAARGLTTNDVEDALRRENVELPAGSIESLDRQFGVRVQRPFDEAADFRDLVLKRGDDGYLVRLGDVARVELGGEEERLSFTGNGEPMVGIGIIKQSQANTVEVSRLVHEQKEQVRKELPDHITLHDSYDSSIFIEAAIDEVYNTLFIAIGLVVLVIYLFLGSVRAMVIPAVTVPVSLIATFIFLLTVGFSLNLLTLLALVLAIGLVVDDAIIVLENIYERVEQGETPLAAAYLGARQVGFAVVATTLVLVAVFVPLVFLEGDLGRLFIEFALTMAAAVCFSSLVALTLTPMLCSKLLKEGGQRGLLTRMIDSGFELLASGYRWLLARTVKVAPIALVILGLSGWAAWGLFNSIPSEFAPREDRGAFFILVNGPEGASYQWTKRYMDEVERRLMYLIDSGEATRLLVRTPRSFGNIAAYNDGIVIVLLERWSERDRSAFTIMNEIRGKLSDMPGIRAFPVMRQGVGGGFSKPVEFVIGGNDYDELAEWRDIILDKARENEQLLGLDSDYKETKPQIGVEIDQDRAGDLGVTILDLSRTLETLLGSRRVTTWLNNGEEYDVILESAYEKKESPLDLKHIYVRSRLTNELIPLSNLVSLTNYAESSTLNRFNRRRAVTIEANVADDYTLGEALTYLEDLAREHLPEAATIDYKGQSRQFKEASASVYLVFMLALTVVFLILAAQFESYIHPLVIMLSVPLAILGALFALWSFGQSINIYSQIGMIMLIGLAAKNGILIVEFVNQLRDEGYEFDEAILAASSRRLRPILMTSITTVMGSVPLLIGTGAGSETRFVIGVVILGGVSFSAVFCLFVIPAMYRLIARGTSSPEEVTRRLNEHLERG